MKYSQKIDSNEIFSSFVHHASSYPDPFVHALCKQNVSLFNVIVAALITAQTTDTVSERAFWALTAIADGPAETYATSLEIIERTLAEVHYYKRKSIYIKEIAAIMCTQKEHTMNNKKFLLTLPGVGNKTANLILGTYFKIPYVAVDTHVLRISYRLGLTESATDPKHAERTLMAHFPQSQWIALNDHGVRFGKHICTARLPRCSQCKLRTLCPKRGVISHK